LKPRSQSGYRSPRLVFSLAILAFFCFLAVFAAQIAPQDPTRMQPSRRNLQAAWMRKPGVAEGFWLGTDRYGRDVFSRLVYGSRTGIFLALTAAPLAALIGTLVGVAAGYAGGWVETVIMRAADIFNAFPAVLFSVLVVLLLREQPLGQALNGLLTLTIAFAAIGWVGLARILRAVVLELKSRLFVEAAQALGASRWQIIRSHILPNLSGLIVVWMVNTVPTVILLEAGLGYLGVEIVRAAEGNEFRVTSWGGLFFEGRSFIYSNPFVLLAPALCVFLITLSFSLLGSYLDRRQNHGRELRI
jgi:ABC-type dipeptide/oligopeptide/nickel transport system permease subunit